MAVENHAFYTTFFNNSYQYIDITLFLCIFAKIFTVITRITVFTRNFA